MVDSAEDDRAIELYAQFRKELHTVPLFEVAPYPRPFEGGSFNLIALGFHTVAQDGLREIANSINDFGRYIRSLHAWHLVYERSAQDDQYNLILEHIRPLSVLCLGAPQALRGRLIYAATATSFHAAAFVKWPDKSPDWNGGHTNMKTARDMSERWSTWPVLAQELSAMGHEQLSSATDDFRNAHEHGHPRGIGIGHISTVRRIPDIEKLIPPRPGAPSTTESKRPRPGWSFGEQPPLKVDDLLPLLRQAHSTALRAFKAYLALVEEQHAAEPPIQ